MAVQSLGVELIPLAANRQFVMRYAMQQHLDALEGEEWFLFPTGLRLPETVEAVEAEVLGLPLAPGTIVIPTGTGTHLAGVLRGFPGSVVAVQGYAREETRFRRDVARMAWGKPNANLDRLRVVDQKRAYFEVRAGMLPPFPAHLHYETPAWAWLNVPGVIESLEQPILFWNVGS
jgi:hypothetical protein